MDPLAFSGTLCWERPWADVNAGCGVLMFVWALVVVTLSELSVVSFLSLSTSKAPLRDCAEGPWAD